MGYYKGEREKHAWDKKNNHLLGTMPDMQVARLVGVPQYIVSGARRRNMIPCYKRKSAADTVKEMSNDELMKTGIREFPSRLRHEVKMERRRRNLPPRYIPCRIFRVGDLNIKQAMIRAALQMNPPPTLTEIGKILNVTRERIRQIANKISVPT